jgi:hypothetical protein
MDRACARSHTSCFRLRAISFAAPAENRATNVGRKIRCTFMIDPDVLDRITSIVARTGVSKSEQIREAIHWWLESREWPIKGQGPDASDRTSGETSRGRRKPWARPAVGRSRSQP